MKDTLQRLIEDPVLESDADLDLFDGEGNRNPKARCIFWKEIINEVKQKGSKAVAGVRGQFSSFQKTQPG